MKTILRWNTLIFASLFFSSVSYASLSATTANTIQGTPPYLSYDGMSVSTSTDELVGITLSNGNSFNFADAAGTVAAPIDLPPGDTFGDIQTLIPAGATNVSLTTLLGPYANDDDGDGNYTATGNLTVLIKDVHNVNVKLTDKPDVCRSPYTFTLNIPNGTLNTQFGYPNSSAFNGTTATYHISANVGPVPVPVACYAIPAKGDSFVNNSLFDTNHFYIGKKAFLPQVAGANFPTTGSHGLYFDLVFFNAKASDITITKLGDPNVNVLVHDYGNPNGDKVKLTLNGPRDSNKPAAAYIPSSFEVKAGATSIYKFTINKWFIVRPSEGPMAGGSAPTFWGLPGGYDGSGTATVGASTESATNYCDNVLAGYKVPSAFDYTNSPVGATGYTRAIGGGIFAEWGDTHGPLLDNINWSPILPATGNYPDSDWEPSNYWASESGLGNNQYNVNTRTGYIINYTNKNSTFIKAACVSP